MIKGVTYLNIFNLLQDQQGQLNMNFSRDGLHLNAKGYEVVAHAITIHLNPQSSVLCKSRMTD